MRCISELRHSRRLGDLLDGPVSGQTFLKRTASALFFTPFAPLTATGSLTEPRTSGAVLQPLKFGVMRGAARGA